VKAAHVFLQNLFAWTDGHKSVRFGRRNGFNDYTIALFRGILHLNDYTSHDVITYDYYLQPPLGGKATL